MCDALNRFHRDAVRALRGARQIRRSKDLSFHEDLELTREAHNKIEAVIVHLLAGHNGRPCPSGTRPIILRSLAPSSQSS
jgi:hypothetical protein